MTLRDRQKHILAGLALQGLSLACAGLFQMHWAVDLPGLAKFALTGLTMGAGTWLIARAAEFHIPTA